MNETLAKRVGSAAVAGWWTILIAAIWMTAGWLFFMAILQTKPDWLLRLWGGGELDWPDVHMILLWFFAAFKLVLFLALIVVIWLSLWARHLRRAGQ